MQHHRSNRNLWIAQWNAIIWSILCKGGQYKYWTSGNALPPLIEFHVLDSFLYKTVENPPIRESIQISDMARCRGLFAIGIFLAALHVFFIQPAYYINGGISEQHLERNSNWEKDSELKRSSSRRVFVLRVAKNGGKGQFHTVQEAINAVPLNNKNPFEIIVQPGTYRSAVRKP